MKTGILEIAKRTAAAAIATFSIFSFSMVNASAAETDTRTIALEAAPLENVQEYNMSIDNGMALDFNYNNDIQIVQLAGDDAAASGDGSSTTTSINDAEDIFDNVVKFFKDWISKVGLVVAFVGGIMFCLAIKSNDAEQKQAGLLTLIAGMAVFALCKAAPAIFGI